VYEHLHIKSISKMERCIQEEHSRKQNHRDDVHWFGEDILCCSGTKHYVTLRQKTVYNLICWWLNKHIFRGELELNWTQSEGVTNGCR